MAALPASAIALPTTDLGPAPGMWFKPDCPRHSTYQTWQLPGRLYCSLTEVAKTVKEDHILGPVMKWLIETFDERKKKSLASYCTCDDDDDAAEGRVSRILLPSHIIFYLPSEGESLPSEGE